MRCLVCGSVISNVQRTCAHCHCDTQPSEQALDVFLWLVFVDACIFYLVKDRMLDAIWLLISVIALVGFIILRRRQMLQHWRAMEIGQEGGQGGAQEAGRKA